MKYFSHPFIDSSGVKWDSKKEYYRWQELKKAQDAFIIFGLKRQVKLEILPKLIRYDEKKLKTKTKVVQRVDEKAKYYTADFVYQTEDHGYIEDVKSSYTKHIRDYPLRRHLVKMLLQKWNGSEGDGYWQFVEVE